MAKKSREKKPKKGKANASTFTTHQHVRVIISPISLQVCSLIPTGHLSVRCLHDRNNNCFRKVHAFAHNVWTLYAAIWWPSCSPTWLNGQQHVAMIVKGYAHIALYNPANNVGSNRCSGGCLSGCFGTMLSHNTMS